MCQRLQKVVEVFCLGINEAPPGRVLLLAKVSKDAGLKTIVKAVWYPRKGKFVVK